MEVVARLSAGTPLDIISFARMIFYANLNHCTTNSARRRRHSRATPYNHVLSLSTLLEKSSSIIADPECIQERSCKQ